MKQTLLISLLLFTGYAVASEQLYRWVEADGSITFSPTKPTDNRHFQKVESAASVNSVSAFSTDASSSNPLQQPTNQATQPTAGEVSQPSLGAALATTPSVNPSNTTRLEYAPETIPINRLHNSQADTTIQSRTAQSVHSASDKRERCQDLSKRVVSLERRLQSKLSAEDMDNTVIHMARYQNSINQYCRR